PAALKVIPEWPLVYWWDAEMLRAYRSAPLIGAVAPAAKGICTSDDGRYMRRPWEVKGENWKPTIHGGKGDAWIEAMNLKLNWCRFGLENKVMHEVRWGSHSKRVQNQQYYFRRGIAFSMIGAT